MLEKNCSILRSCREREDIDSVHLAMRSELSVWESVWKWKKPGKRAVSGHMPIEHNPGHEKERTPHRVKNLLLLLGRESGVEGDDFDRTDLRAERSNE